MKPRLVLLLVNLVVVAAWLGRVGADFSWPDGH
jgi:hypothetical protein